MFYTLIFTSNLRCIKYLDAITESISLEIFYCEIFFVTLQDKVNSIVDNRVQITDYRVILNSKLQTLITKLNMARILAIDYGQKRTGIAVTDTLQMIANGLTTVETPKLYAFLADYFAREEVETIVIGYPKTLRNEPAEVTKLINPFIEKLRKLYPDKKIELIDERFTSKMAFQTMIDSGIGKKARQNKALIDQISATIILQNYLESKH